MKYLSVLLAVIGMAGCLGCQRAHDRPVPKHGTGVFQDCTLDTLSEQEAYRLYEANRRGSDDMIKTFRRCKNLVTQDELEPWVAFVRRVGVPTPYSCILVREREQNTGDNLLRFDNGVHDVTVIGGYFTKQIPVEKERP